MRGGEQYTIVLNFPIDGHALISLGPLKDCRDAAREWGRRLKIDCSKRSDRVVVWKGWGGWGPTPIYPTLVPTTERRGWAIDVDQTDAADLVVLADDQNLCMRRAAGYAERLGGISPVSKPVRISVVRRTK
ncbi:MAG: hypothetical protein LC135_01945 [Phycisphaerae bacterium]|nr:hypothetical protein [Phycisphaerae bacterium]MCZ2398616.1 hypothetical protein [Phycisphaerae bacterium]